MIRENSCSRTRLDPDARVAESSEDLEVAMAAATQIDLIAYEAICTLLVRASIALAGKRASITTLVYGYRNVSSMIYDRRATAGYEFCIGIVLFRKSKHEHVSIKVVVHLMQSDAVRNRYVE